VKQLPFFAIVAAALSQGVAISLVILGIFFIIMWMFGSTIPIHIPVIHSHHVS